MTDLYRPLQSLREGHWFKLICGASYQHLAHIRDLTLVYTLAGANCIDVAADPAVITAAQEAIQMATALVDTSDFNLAPTVDITPTVHPDFLAAHRPWLMVSLNDGEDPHFRKAHFDADRCPSDCPRPCERICPAQAIAFPAPPASQGVIADRCYGCGRCLPVCPLGQIVTEATVVNPTQILPQIIALGIDAIEIHTQIGRVADFQRLWSAIVPYCPHLKLIAVSFPDGDDAIAYLWTLYELIRASWPGPLIWQTDGRPMSGDLGKGTTHAALKLAQKVLAAGPPGYVQLAGGTNAHTVTKAYQLGLLTPPGQPISCEPGPQRTIAGIAYGSYARAQLRQWLETGLAGEGEREVRREEREVRGLLGDRLWSAVQTAAALVWPLKAGFVACFDREDISSPVPSLVAAARPP